MSSIGAAETGQSKKKLLQIVSPTGQCSKEDSNTNSWPIGGCIGQDRGFRRLSISARTPICRGPDDASPDSRTFDNIDTNYILGEYPGYDTQTGECDDHEQKGDNGNGKKNSSNEKTKKTSGQRIVLFALRLALIEKAASGIGKLAFLWATVVILGGFATTVTFDNFWVVTVIILAEGSRIFSRSHELEMRQLPSKSNGGMDLPHCFHRAARSIRSQRRRASLDTISSIEATTTTAQTFSSVPWGRWSIATLPLLPFEVGRVLTMPVVSQILHLAQLTSAMMCIGLSLWRLTEQNFYEIEAELPPRNVKSSVTVSMNVFYALAILEAGLFLLERSYWEYRIRVTKLLDYVRDEVDLGIDSADMLRQFFYDVYERCLKGSIFDALDMDLVSYSISWLQYEGFKQQLAGARVFNRFVLGKKDRFAWDALRRLWTTPGIIERLVDMLSWNSTHDREKGLVQEIATIICELVVNNRNGSRFVAVPGFTDAVVALLLAPDSSSTHLTVEHNDFELRLTGLRILRHLCKDHKICAKIGETKGLVPSLMVFIEVTGDGFTSDGIPGRRHETLKRSLQVLLLLAAATNTSGRVLRRKIAAMVSGLKNLRDVIQFGSAQPELQRLAVEILYHLAMEEDLRTNIGATGGVIRKLFDLFAQFTSLLSVPLLLTNAMREYESKANRKIREQRRVAEKAGEALSRLVLQNQGNCLRLLEVSVGISGHSLVPCMVNSLSQPDSSVASSAAKVLRSVLNYADDSTQVAITTKCVPAIVQNIFTLGPFPTKSEMYEASLGLASRALKFLDAATYVDILQKVNKTDFVKRLVKNLQHTPTTNKYPRIRRYSVELILAFTAKDDSFLHAFQLLNRDLKTGLTNTLESISEVENFCLFSGLIGYTRHNEEMEGLVKRCIEAVDNYIKREISSSETSL